MSTIPSESELARLIRESKPPLPPAIRELLRHHRAAEIIECVLAMKDSELHMAKAEFDRAQLEAEAAHAAAIRARASAPKTAAESCVAGLRNVIAEDTKK
ncbi:hypothetical protein [Roseateles sp. PN1]|uniref:hypothetical protein n=1 Tax=Roseateles sp. PN1 TaxID=3137372 RepID=UPI0031397282